MRWASIWGMMVMCGWFVVIVQWQFVPVLLNPGEASLAGPNLTKLSIRAGSQGCRSGGFLHAVAREASASARVTDWRLSQQGRYNIRS